MSKSRKTKQKQYSHLSPEYAEYIRSPLWHQKRLQALTFYGEYCHACKAEPSSLDIHHLSYTHFTNEPMEDLIPLCRDCHSEIHRLHDGRKALPLRPTLRDTTMLVLAEFEVSAGTKGRSAVFAQFELQHGVSLKPHRKASSQKKRKNKKRSSKPTFVISQVEVSQTAFHEKLINYIESIPFTKKETEVYARTLVMFYHIEKNGARIDERVPPGIQDDLNRAWQWAKTDDDAKGHYFLSNRVKNAVEAGERYERNSSSNMPKVNSKNKEHAGIQRKRGHTPKGWVPANQRADYRDPFGSRRDPFADRNDSSLLQRRIQRDLTAIEARIAAAARLDDEN